MHRPDVVWVSDFGVGTLSRFDPARGQFSRIAQQNNDVWIRQLLGRPGEVWDADSADDRPESDISTETVGSATSMEQTVAYHFAGTLPRRRARKPCTNTVPCSVSR
jgi:hypothetical protein